MALMPSNLLTGSVLTKVEIIPKDWERLSENKGLSLILTTLQSPKCGWTRSIPLLSKHGLQHTPMHATQYF